jgi:hypothetical protein
MELLKRAQVGKRVFLTTRQPSAGLCYIDHIPTKLSKAYHVLYRAGQVKEKRSSGRIGRYRSHGYDQGKGHGDVQGRLLTTQERPADRDAAEDVEHSKIKSKVSVNSTAFTNHAESVVEVFA